VFGLDEVISGLAHGSNPWVVLVVALLLGLRHATDPDHVVAVSTLVAMEPERRVPRAGVLGAAWGAGHASAVLAIGLPFVLLAVLVPQPVQSSAEVLVGVVIVLLGLRLLCRGPQPGHRHAARSPLAAYGIGVLHGVGGSAFVTLVLLGAIGGRGDAAAALGLFALGTMASMALLSAGLGLALGARRAQSGFRRLAPALAVSTCLFGVVYAAGAVGGVA
jgi:hypothetical protein